MHLHGGICISAQVTYSHSIIDRMKGPIPMLKEGDHVRIREDAATAYGRSHGAAKSGITAWLRVNAGADAVVVSKNANGAGEVVVSCHDGQQRPVLADSLELIPEGKWEYFSTMEHRADIIAFANFFRRKLTEDQYREVVEELGDLHVSLPPYLPWFRFEPGDVVYTRDKRQFIRDEWGGWRCGGKRFPDDEWLLRMWRGNLRWRLLFRAGELCEGEQPFDN